MLTSEGFDIWFPFYTKNMKSGAGRRFTAFFLFFNYLPRLSL